MTRIAEIMLEAKARLKAVECGVEMLSAGQGDARTGVRNVAVFGRMVTFATNNLRSVVEGFIGWDVKAKQRHFDCDECRYMYRLRNVIEKQARTPVSVSAHIRSLDTSDLARFPRPPRATSFFVGDRNGGSGWMILNADGEKTPFYIDLPPEVGEAWLDLPEFGGRRALDVSNTYLISLENYLLDVEDFINGNKQ